MVCPFCFHEKTDVSNSRKGRRLNNIWRRRRCPACSAQFTTYESADPSSILTFKNGRQVSAFSHTKLLLELLQACDHRDDLDESVPYLAETIEQKLYHIAAHAQKPMITQSDLFTTTSETLQRYDPVAYVKYIGRHQKSLDSAALRRALKPKK